MMLNDGTQMPGLSPAMKIIEGSLPLKAKALHQDEFVVKLAAVEE